MALLWEGESEDEIDDYTEPSIQCILSVPATSRSRARVPEHTVVGGTLFYPEIVVTMETSANCSCGTVGDDTQYLTVPEATFMGDDLDDVIEELSQPAIDLTDEELTPRTLIPQPIPQKPSLESKRPALLPHPILYTPVMYQSVKKLERCIAEVPTNTVQGVLPQQSMKSLVSSLDPLGRAASVDSQNTPNEGELEPLAVTVCEPKFRNDSKTHFRAARHVIPFCVEEMQCAVSRP